MSELDFVVREIAGAINRLLNSTPNSPQERIALSELDYLNKYPITITGTNNAL